MQRLGVPHGVPSEASDVPYMQTDIIDKRSGSVFVERRGMDL